MSRKNLYIGIACLCLFLLALWTAKLRNPQKDLKPFRSGREVYETLMSLRPGTSLEKAKTLLGNPDDVSENVLTWFLMDEQGEFAADFNVLTSQDRVIASSYLESAEGEKVASKKYKIFERELRSILGPPREQISDLLSVWVSEKLQFILAVTFDEEISAVTLLLKEPLVEGM